MIQVSVSLRFNFLNHLRGKNGGAADILLKMQPRQISDQYLNWGHRTSTHRPPPYFKG